MRCGDGNEWVSGRRRARADTWLLMEISRGTPHFLWIWYNLYYLTPVPPRIILAPPPLKIVHTPLISPPAYSPHNPLEYWFFWSQHLEFSQCIQCIQHLVHWFLLNPLSYDFSRRLLNHTNHVRDPPWIRSFNWIWTRRVVSNTNYLFWYNTRPAHCN